VIDSSRLRGRIALPPRRLELRKEHLLHEIGLATTPRRRALWVALATAVVLLAAAGTGLAVGGFDWLTQQNRFDSPGPGGPPPLVGKRVVFASGVGWAAVAWRGRDEGLCIDIATPGHSANACGLPVPGAAAPREAEGNLRLAAGATSGSGPGYLLTAGAAVRRAARVDVELTDGRVIQTAIADAPAEVDANLRLFWARFRWPHPAGLGHPAIRRYLVYDATGAEIGASPG
jgi:hypothetical protein